MPKLLLERCESSFETDSEFRKRTEVLIWGDVAAYKHLQSLFQKACHSRNNVHVDIIKPCETSMQCVILPAARAPRKRPKLKISERKIYCRREPEMELIFYGNTAGYGLISDIFGGMLDWALNKPGEHTHVDDWGFPAMIDPYGVILNIRGPVLQWNRKNLAEYAPFLAKPKREAWYYPDPWELKNPRQEKYQEPIAGKDPFVLR